MGARTASWNDFDLESFLADLRPLEPMGPATPGDGDPRDADDEAETSGSGSAP